MRMARSELICLSLCWLLAACEQRAAEPDAPPKTQSSAVAVADPTEFKSEDLKPGEGSREVKKGDLIKVNYVGKLFKNGNKFDSNTDKKKPFEFTVGEGVIDGWSEGVIGMKKGGKRKLTIPAKLAYGDQEKPKIPKNSALVFEIDLLGWSDEPDAPATAEGSAGPAASAAPSTAPSAAASASPSSSAKAAPAASAKPKVSP